MKYFAYGSNMSLARLSARAPGARRIGSGILRGHELRFHKIGKDFSGKCNALHTRVSAHYVVGALFEIDAHGKTALDEAEGLGRGYDEKIVLVETDRGRQHSAVMYYATLTDDMLKPYSWYKHHVLVGARESALPAHYIRQIAAVESIEDPDESRDASQRALHRQAEPGQARFG